MKFILPFGITLPGSRYVDRDTPGAIVGSKIPADFPNIVMDELVRVIEKSGITPDDVLQLAESIRSQRMNYLVAGGTSSAITIAPNPVFSSLPDLIGVPIRVLISATNPGAATLNVNGLGAIAITRFGGMALQPGDLVPGVASLLYDGTTFQLLAFASQIVSNVEALTTVGAGTYTVKAGVYRLKARVWGGGGGSGGAYNGGNSGGGGGGGYAEGFYAVTPGQVISTNVGAGGTAGLATTTPTAGGAGGSSSFGAFLSAAGGSGGAPAAASGVSAAGGSGGSATGGNIINVVGGASSGGLFGVGAGGGNGGAPYGIPGIPSGGYNGAGVAGVVPGGGAGGTGAPATGANFAGGAGGRGQIILEY